MSKLKTLSGDEIIRIFEKFGFSVAHQKGSHVKLKRIVGMLNQTLTIPRHHELDKGTLLGIYRVGSRYISEGDLKPYFYSE